MGWGIEGGEESGERVTEARAREGRDSVREGFVDDLRLPKSHEVNLRASTNTYLQRLRNTKKVFSCPQPQPPPPHLRPDRLGNVAKRVDCRSADGLLVRLEHLQQLEADAHPLARRHE